MKTPAMVSSSTSRAHHVYVHKAQCLNNSSSTYRQYYLLRFIPSLPSSMTLRCIPHKRQQMNYHYGYIARVSRGVSNKLSNNNHQN
jgi:hypothetical protein